MKYVHSKMIIDFLSDNLIVVSNFVNNNLPNDLISILKRWRNKKYIYFNFSNFRLPKFF